MFRRRNISSLAVPMCLCFQVIIFFSFSQRQATESETNLCDPKIIAQLFEPAVDKLHLGKKGEHILNGESGISVGYIIWHGVR